jgi:hypothetical protein
MENTEPKPNLAKALIALIHDCAGGIEKNMTVGAGQNAYKAIADKDVKALVGKNMAKHGLCLLPLEINPTLEINRWEETTQYGNNPPITKPKMSVMTVVEPKYLLLHESGESVVVSGYGHGIDTQDKSAGKATTYAMKYLMLYLGLVPTGLIDDADNKHSDEQQQPAQQQKQQAAKAPVKKEEPKPITEEQFQQILSSDLKKATQSLQAIKKGTKVTATAEQIVMIENRIIELEKEGK